MDDAIFSSTRIRLTRLRLALVDPPADQYQLSCYAGSAIIRPSTLTVVTTVLSGHSSVPGASMRDTQRRQVPTAMMLSETRSDHPHHFSALTTLHPGVGRCNFTAHVILSTICTVLVN